MDPMTQRARAEGGPANVDLLIEKGFLLLGSIEFQIDEHLMAHGTRIDAETRFFMARVRDAAGDAAAKLLDEARTRIDAVPVASDGAPKSKSESESGAAAEAEGQGASASPFTLPRRRIGKRLAIGRAARQSALGTGLAMALVTLLLVGHPREPVAHDDPADMTVAEASGSMPKAVLQEPSVSKPQTSVAPTKAAASDGAASDRVEKARPATAPWRVVALARRKTPFPPYPDPLAGMERTRAEVEEAAAAAEAALGLTRQVRREVQRRLALAEFDPQLFDGIFGPATRDALSDWQRRAGLTATGYLDGEALARLRELTAERYESWQAAERVRRRRQETRTVILSSPVPPDSPARPDRCRRKPSGKIVYGRGVRCDFRGLKEDLAKLFG